MKSRPAPAWLIACAAVLLSACATDTQPHSRDTDAMTPTRPDTLRVAIYNTSLFDEDAGGRYGR